jgi:radical SAM superfamily enzyme YgiQ (UPF0313 family)
LPRLLLIQSSHRSGEGGRLAKQGRLHLPGLALPLLAAMAPPSWQVDIKYELIETIDGREEADLVGISAMGHGLFRGLELGRMFQGRGIPVFFGGAMASLAPWVLGDVAASVVIGDAECSFPALLEDFEQGRPLRPVYDLPIDSLAGLPIPRYDLLASKAIGGMLPVQAGRGCNHGCTFCSIAALYKGRYLQRPASEVLRDVKEVRRLGYRKFLLIDDNIMSDPDYLLELCEGFEPLGMTWASQCSLSIADHPRHLAAARKSGCRILSFGIETLQQGGLDGVKKPWVRASDHARLLRQVASAGILPSTEMMLGLDEDTEATLDATLTFVHAERLPLPRFYVLTPIPGTPLFDQLKREGRLLHEDFELYTGYHCVHQPKGLLAEALDQKFDQFNRRVYALSSILWRTFLNPALLRNPWGYVLAGLVNIQYRAHVRRHDIPVVY